MAIDINQLKAVVKFSLAELTNRETVKSTMHAQGRSDLAVALNFYTALLCTFITTSNGENVQKKLGRWDDGKTAPRPVSM